MPVLSAANVIQAKTDWSTVASTSIPVDLDAPTTGGGTVTVEMYGPPLWPGQPDGWEYDVMAGQRIWYFRRSNVPAGESTWTWTSVSPVTAMWRVTEWDAGLDPVSPLEAANGTSTGGAGVTTLSTGTGVPNPNSRAETVALAMHCWTFSQPGGDPTRVVTFTGHTNSFTVRDTARLSPTNQDLAACWSWVFDDTVGSFETTATVGNNAPDASDVYYAAVAAYAATVPVLEVPADINASGG
jgi:hypothetical protein